MIGYVSQYIKQENFKSITHPPLHLCPDARGVHSSDKTRRKPHGVRASGVLERQFLRSRNDDKNSVIFKIIGFLFL